MEGEHNGFYKNLEWKHLHTQLKEIKRNNFLGSFLGWSLVFVGTLLAYVIVKLL